MIRKIIFILVGCLVALSSCQWDGKSGNTADVDVELPVMIVCSMSMLR